MPRLLFSILIVSLLGCFESKNTETETNAQDSAEAIPPSDEPSIAVASPTLRRLTIAQYHNIITDVFGDGLLIPSNLEPDISYEGLQALGATITTLSPVGIERYESASYSITEQIVENPEKMTLLFPCDTSVDSCVQDSITDIGKQLWRRPLENIQIERLMNIYHSVSLASDTNTGIQYALAAVLQSPHFLYRMEYSPTLTAYELASRLGFFLWNSAPDLELLELAESGELLDVAILAEQVDRMMLDPKHQQGLRNFFTELLSLYELDTLTKDPLVFDHASPDLYQSAKEETLRTIQYIIENDQDFRDILTTQTTFVDRRLAALYDIPAPSMTGFGEVWLDASQQRRGLLMQASMLNIHAHSTSTSATKRGIFIRKTLLCQKIPPPPANVDTSLPEATSEAPTLRERLQVHFEEPSCAVCHEMMDLVGLGLENFDGIGRWRNRENGGEIDPSGLLDGAEFLDAWELAETVKNHDNFGSCLSEHVYAYAMGHVVDDDQEAFRDWLVENLQYSNWSFDSLLRTIALSETFRKNGVE